MSDSDPKWAVEQDVVETDDGRLMSVVHVVRTDEPWHDLGVFVPLDPANREPQVESMCECATTIEYVDGNSDLVLVVHDSAC